MFDDIPDILTAKECYQLLKTGKNSMLRYLKTGEIEGSRSAAGGGYTSLVLLSF